MIGKIKNFFYGNENSVSFTPEYEKLLTKFCKDEDLIRLIELCIIDDCGRREFFYKVYKKYPEQQDRLMKLKDDLMAREYELIREEVRK